MEADRSFPSSITDTRPTRLAVWLWATVMEGPCICMYYLHGSSFLLESCQVPGMFCRHVNFHASTCTCLWVSNWTVSDIRARTHLRSRWSASATECECASRLCCPIDAWSRVSPHRVSMVLQFSKQRCDICPLHSLPLHALFIFTRARRWSVSYGSIDATVETGNVCATALPAGDVPNAERHGSVQDVMDDPSSHSHRRMDL
jgi:hypothetical protein